MRIEGKISIQRVSDKIQIDIQDRITGNLTTRIELTAEELGLDINGPINSSCKAIYPMQCLRNME